MKKPKVGQVLATRSGEKFRVSDLISTFEADDPESDPNGFMVYLDPVDGLHAVASDWEADGMLNSEFEDWCSSNGVSY